VLAIGLALAGVGLMLFAATTQYAVFALAAVLMGVAAAPALMVTETLLQEATEPGVRGRVFGARDFLMRSVLLLSVGLAGWLTRQAGARSALLVAGVLVLGVSGLAILRLTAAARTPR
jgi:MFS family permease